MCAQYPSHNLFHSRLARFTLGAAGDVGRNAAKAHKQACASMCADSTSARQHTDTLVAVRFVRFFLSLPGYSVYTHSTSPLTVRRLLPPCCQRSPAENKRGRELGLRFLNQRKLVLITLPLKKHSDPVNPFAGCQL